jgi:non-ribosomal peptide synthetase component F
VILPHEAIAVKQHVAGELLNVYGPTENTTFSLLFLLSEEEKCTPRVPIGRALSNSGACVMDSKLQLVPLGVIGELVVTGDGVARGYTDPNRDVDRFVSVNIAGETVKAYRTGDYVRTVLLTANWSFSAVWTDKSRSEATG